MPVGQDQYGLREYRFLGITSLSYLSVIQLVGAEGLEPSPESILNRVPLPIGLRPLKRMNAPERPL